MSEPYTLYKNPSFSFSTKGKRGHREKTALKHLKTSYFGPNREPINRKLIYELLDERASKAIPEKFCDVLGFETSNTHQKHFLHFFDSLVFKYIKGLTPNAKDEFRALRNIKKGF